MAIARGKAVFRLKGGRFSPLENQVSTTVDDSIAGARLNWMPDVYFMQAHELLRPCNNLNLLCIFQTHNELPHVSTKAEHLRKFQVWLDEQAERADHSAYPMIDDKQTLARMGHKERRPCIEHVRAEMEQGVGGETGSMLLRVLQHCTAVIAEHVGPIDILQQEDGLKSLDDFFQDMWDCQRLFELLGHAKPSLRILEIGARTGGTTARVLKDLVSGSGDRMYCEYCYIDISPGFFIAAKERFKDFQNIRFAVLDIIRDPMEQGFEANSYHLILAATVSPISRSRYVEC